MSDHYDADALLDEMSSNLRADVLLFLDSELVEKIPFFKDKIPQFVADVLSMLQPLVFQSGDFIVKEGEKADEMCVRFCVFLGYWVLSFCSLLIKI